MFGPRTPRYPLLKAYLEARPTSSPIANLGMERGGLLVASGVTFVTGISNLATLPAAGFVLMGVGGVLALFGLRRKPAPPPTPEQEMSRRADEVAKRLKEHAYLHRALHPAVGATLEECAGYWSRIVAALEGPQWSEGEAARWSDLRREALLATKLAMDEAIVHAGTTLIAVPPPRPLDHVSDVLEDVGFGPLVRDGRGREPMPPSFRPVRDLAERLRELATRCETAATQRREESPEPLSVAFRHLDAALGEMRHLEEAEGELKQGA